MEAVTAVAVIGTVAAYIVGYYVGFRLAVSRCHECGEKNPECVCDLFEPWDEDIDG